MNDTALKKWNIALCAVSFFMILVAIAGFVVTWCYTFPVWKAAISENNSGAQAAGLAIAAPLIVICLVFLSAVQLLGIIPSIIGGALHAAAIKKPEMSGKAALTSAILTIMNFISAIGFFILVGFVKGHVDYAQLILGVIIAAYAIFRIVYVIVFKALQKRAKKTEPPVAE